MSDQLTPAWVLHARKYRDTSLIVELLTGEYGRVAVVARGARSKGGRLASNMQPFRLFLAGWRGKGEMKTLTRTDFPAPPMQISGQRLLIGMYLNELIVRLLTHNDPFPQMVSDYGQLLSRLAVADEDTRLSSDIEPALRIFEFRLLEQLGYGVTFDVDVSSGQMISPTLNYRFHPGTGFVATDEPGGYPGTTLLRIAAQDFDNESTRVARQVARAAIDDLLGGKPLMSRQMYRSLKTYSA